MILRQLITRHSRSSLASSAQCSRRFYATEISHTDPIFRPSTQDHQPQSLVPGHPSDSSSILDSSSLPPTLATRDIAEQLSSIVSGIQSVQNDLNVHKAASQNRGVNKKKQSQPIGIAPAFANVQAFVADKKAKKEHAKLGSRLVNVYNPYHIIENPPTPDAITLPMLLANQTHLGHATSLWNPANSSYIFGIRDGIHIISLEVTLAYLRRAAKVVMEVARRGGIILFVGTRKGHRDIIVNAAKLGSAYHIFDRWIPGSLTNGQQILAACNIQVVNKSDEPIEKFTDRLHNSDHPVLRPDLVICMNPLENHVCLHECGLYNVPTIGVVDTDANPTWVTYPIPANDDSLRSVALIAGALARAAEEGQRSRKESAAQGELTYNQTRVQKYLEGLEEITDMGNIQDNRGGKRDNKEVD